MKNKKKFTLPASVTIENIREVTEQLKALNLQAGDSLTLDASATDHITTPGIQLLLSLDKTIRQGSGTLTISQPKDAFSEALKLAGVNNLLEK